MYKPKNGSATHKKLAFIGAGTIIFLLTIVIFLLPIHFWNSYAATGSSNDTATATALSASSDDPFTQFCNAFYHITSSTLSTDPVDKYNECLGLSPLFQHYLQSHNLTYLASSSSPTATPTTESTGSVWPIASLVALENTDATQTGNMIPSTDAARVERNLTTYFQSQVTDSQQNTNQDVLNNWNGDPLLPLALVTYTLTPPSNQPLFADATDGNPSFTTLTTFLTSDPIELAHIQVDLAANVKSTTYQASGVDCSFSNHAITQSYQSCLGTDTLVDLIYAENIDAGADATIVYTNANAILANEFSNGVGGYLHAHSTDTTVSNAQTAYTFISAMTNQKMKETVIDHLLSDVVKDTPITLCTSPTTTLQATPPVSSCPSVTPTVQVSATPVATPTDTPQSQPTPSSTPTVLPQITPPSNKIATSMDLPLSVFQTLPTDANTWYSAPNNDPPGYDSYPHARGTGTYTNPVTFAIADDSKTFSQGTVIYIPELEKYFIAEDTCAACADDLAQGHQDHIDLWVGDLPSSCADNIQVPSTIYSQSSEPEPIHYLIVSSSDTADQNYTVNQTPFTCGNS